MQLTPSGRREDKPDYPAAGLYAIGTSGQGMYVNPAQVVAVVPGEVGKAVLMLRDGTAIGVRASVVDVAAEVEAAALRMQQQRSA